MPHGNGSSAETQGRPPPTTGAPDAGDRLLRVLRQAHVFASVVHDLLEGEPRRSDRTAPLTGSQLQLLRLACCENKPQVGEAAAFLGMSPPAASKNVEKLVRLGLLARRRVPGDRRARALAASPEGRRFLDRSRRLEADRAQPALESFSDGELDLLAGLLERFSLCLLGGWQSPDEECFCLRCSGHFDDRCPVARLSGRRCPYEELRYPAPGHTRSGQEAPGV